MTITGEYHVSHTSEMYPLRHQVESRGPGLLTGEWPGPGQQTRGEKMKIEKGRNEIRTGKLRVGQLVVLVLLSLSLILLTSIPAIAWKPVQHIHQGNEAIAEILDGHNYVTINGEQYAVPSEVAQAIRNYPDHYHAGCAGPDGFPDITFGQIIIHPDWKSDDGTYGTYTHEWLDHIYHAGWDYYADHGGDADAQQALAFTYGFLTHCGGDLWGHTLINDFAGGIWPDIPEGDDVTIAIRHIIVEEYIAQHVPGTDLSFAAPSDFIYYAFIDNSAAMDLAQGAAINELFGIPYFVELRADLVEEKNGIDCDWWQPWDWLDCAKREYLGHWIDDIDDGLEAWPVRMTRVAKKLFVEDDLDGGMRKFEQFAYDHLLSMYGAPDFVGDFLDLWDGLTGWIEDLIDVDIPGFSDLVVYLIEQRYGIDFDELKEYFTNPAAYINSPPLFPTDTSDRLDVLMHAAGGDFDPELFAANENSIVTAKMILLSPGTLNELLADLGVGALYGGVNPEVPPAMWENVMLGFIRSIDGNHQWRRFPFDDPGTQHSEGMPLWVDCQARDGAFRVLFTDWEADGFPDSGEDCLCWNDIAPTVYVGGDISIDEGSVFESLGIFEDLCSDAWTATVDYGDGGGAQALVLDDWTFLLNHAYGDNGSYTVTVTVTDDDGGSGYDSFAVTVSNVAPTASIDGYTSPVEGCILPGEQVVFDGSFTDPGWLDTHTAEWNFGDGTELPGTLTEENEEPDATGTVTDVHIYVEPGTYAVALTVDDDDGGIGSDQTEVKVMTASEAVDFINDYVQGLPDGCFKKPAQLRRDALAEKFEATKAAIAAGGLQGAITRLVNDIRSKADGTMGGDAGDDWITCPEGQAQLCLMVDQLVMYLETLKDGGRKPQPVDAVSAPHSGDDLFLSSTGAPLFAVLAPYPQPCSSEVWMPYTLSEAADVSIHIHDIAGHLVRTLHVGHKPAGFHTTRDGAAYWDGRNAAGSVAPSGIYFYVVRAGEFSATGKMIVLR